MLRKVTELLFGKKAADHLLASHEQHTQAHQQQQARKDYIAREAAIGARLLGPIPSGISESSSASISIRGYGVRAGGIKMDSRNSSP